MERHQVDVWQYPTLLIERYICAPGPIEGVARHTHEQYQFCLSTDIACVYDYRGARHIVPRGNLSIIHPGEPHATSDAEPRLPGVVYHMLYLHPSVLHEIAAEIGGHSAGQPYFPIPVLSDDSLLHLFHQLYSTLETGVDQLERDVLYYTTFSHLVTYYAQDCFLTSTKVSPRLAVLRARDFLHDNLFQNISLEDLAQISGLSAFRLCHAFKKEIGLSPHEYHLHIRIMYAKSLIISGLPLAQVAQKTGFYDQSRFGRYFKRFIGTTPAYYARNSKICL